MSTNKLHPEKWFMPFRPLAQAQLAADETMAMAMMFTIETEGKDLIHALFCVIRKGNKVLSRNIISHVDEEGFCPGHADDTAEYDAVDEKAMIQETRNQVLQFAAMLVAERGPVTIDINKPVYYIQTPRGQSNKQILAKMMEDREPEGETAKQVINALLGLDSTPIANAPVISDVIVNKSPTSNLAKAAEEMALIKKFGKKNIESLAKKMNYKGEIINKTKK